MGYKWTLYLLSLLMIMATHAMTRPTHENKRRELRITGWNSRGFWVAKPYMLHLMQNADIVAISEHKLYPHELQHLNTLNSDYVAWGRSSADLELKNYGKVPGHCGVALLWRKSLSSCVQPLKHLGNDRICAIRIGHSSTGYAVPSTWEW